MKNRSIDYCGDRVARGTVAQLHMSSVPRRIRRRNVDEHNQVGVDRVQEL